MNFEIRKESPDEYGIVENVVRESFWNIYRPGCHEHFILHNYRNNKDYISDLSKIITADGKIIGQILFSKAMLTHLKTGEQIQIATFGPVSILPEYQKKGYGKALILDGLQKAEKLGISHIIIFGDPGYYKKFGFINAVHSGVLIDGQEEDKELEFVMIKRISDKNTVSRITGPWIYKVPDGYNIDEKELEIFDRKFPEKVKEKHTGQLK